jgi:hypothetical protein
MKEGLHKKALLAVEMHDYKQAAGFVFTLLQTKPELLEDSQKDIEEDEFFKNNRVIKSARDIWQQLLLFFDQYDQKQAQKLMKWKKFFGDKGWYIIHYLYEDLEKTARRN